MKVSFAALTDVGSVRQNNEDCFAVVDAASGSAEAPPPESTSGSSDTSQGALVLGVADGMGGALAGEVASRMAVNALMDVVEGVPAESGFEVLADGVHAAVTAANQRIFEASQQNPKQRGMGTTLTAALMVGSRVRFYQVGDSKAYVYRNDELRQMTKDHSLIGRLIDDKVISPEEAERIEGGKNIILQALGAEAAVRVDLSETTLEEGDLLLLCTDGLHGTLKHKEMEAFCREEEDHRRLCEVLVEEALRQGGPDNITALTLRVTGAGEGPLEAPPSEKAGRFLGRWLTRKKPAP